MAALVTVKMQPKEGHGRATCLLKVRQENCDPWTEFAREHSHDSSPNLLYLNLRLDSSLN